MENKLHFIINTYLRASKRKSYDPINLNINMNEMEIRDFTEEYRDKDTVRQNKLSSDFNYGAVKKRKEMIKQR